MTTFGYALSSEEHPPGALVEHAVAAEAAGFEFLSVSDHIHPWLEAQGHSPFVWAVLGAIASRTEHVRVGTGVTCPILRQHPVLVAHAAATASLLLEGRFFLGVGSGEALNEHVLGQRWPAPEVRLEMLEEAVAVIRDLLTGETVDRRGCYYTVENVRLFDPPVDPLPIVVSGFGPAAAELAGRIGDGYWGHGSDPALVQAFEQAGGRGDRYTQVNCCWGPDASDARDTLARVWPTAGVPGQLSQDLPTWTHFAQAASLVRPEDLADQIPCGPDIVGSLVGKVEAARAAGFDHVYFHQVGPDQTGFLRFWEAELRPAVSGVVVA